ncbi:MAG: hypothetical protein KKA79_09370, partial [Nanoarchaeota archaeon]|nr:hypothetical protein [Nanoarchaeota archaeon]
MKDQKIFAYMHLEDLIPEVESDLKKTIDEREKLGLSIPEKYQVLTTYSSHEQTSGTAHYSEDLGTICLNILSPLFHELSEEDYSKLMFINNYYDNSRKVFTHEDWIIQSLTEPKGLFDKFETEAFKDEEHLEGFKKNFDATGTTYDQYKEFIIENSEKASTFFNDLLPKLKEGFKKSEEPISTLRHEFDHVDFMENSKLHKKINDEGKEVEKLRKEFWEKQNPETSKKYSEAYYEWTSKKMQLDSLVESRAFFFDCIESGKFENADLELEKNRVYSKILFHYIEGSFVPQILDAVIASAWSQRAMN